MSFDTTPFAKLIPSNASARRAFDSLAQNMKDDPVWKPHSRRYIHVNAEKKEVPNVSMEGYGPYEGRKEIWTGFYILSFGVAPIDPRRGWSIGGGIEAAVDILLTENNDFDDIVLQHARLVHTFATGQLTLVPSFLGVVAIDGNDVLDHQRLIHSYTTGLSFGNLNYKLNIQYVSEKEHRRRLRLYKAVHHLEESGPPMALMATPGPSDYVYNDWVVKNPVGEGKSYILFAGFHRVSAETVAIKKFKRNVLSETKIASELSALHMLGFHRHVSELKEGIDTCEEEGGAQNYTKIGVDEVYLVYSPLARSNLEKILQDLDTLHDDFVVNVFWQCIDGLSHIHAHGLMHRDIQPRNISLASLNPPRVVLINFGEATDDLEPTWVSFGNKAYWAPEVWDLRNEKPNSGPYRNSVDMFAFGACAYQLFRHCESWWGEEMSTSAIDVMHSHLKSMDSIMVSVSLARLVRMLLSIPPNERPGAEEAKHFQGVVYDPGNFGTAPAPTGGQALV